eukprot:11208898-Lingulodinium_polyedra.AAC.1
MDGATGARPHTYLRLAPRAPARRSAPRRPTGWSARSSLMQAAALISDGRRRRIGSARARNGPRSRTR